MSAPQALRKVLSRSQNPAILPVPPRTTGNNVPKSLHKTRRSWYPNTARTDWPVYLPAAFAGDLSIHNAGESSAGPSRKAGHVLQGVEMQMRRRKDVEKAGGIEGLLLSRPSKHLTPFGKQLRSALFDELHRIRADKKADRREMKQGLDEKVAPTPTPEVSPHTPPTATPVPGGGDESILTGSGR